MSFKVILPAGTDVSELLVKVNSTEVAIKENVAEEMDVILLLAKDADDTEKVAGEMVTSLLLAKVMVLDPRKRSDNCLVVSKLNLPLRELI